MPYVKPTSSDNIFQMNPDDLLATYPDFYAAGDAIRGVASKLRNAVSTAASAFDGDSQKKIQSLGNEYVTNLQELATAIDQIASRLHQTALAAQKQEDGNSRLFDLNS